jgi:ArsR family transcriptional regulator
MDVKSLNDAADEVSDFLKALAMPIRLRILCALSGGELSVSEIIDRVHLSQTLVSQHLALLRKGGMVAARSQKRARLYRLTDPRVQHIMAVLAESFCPSGGPDRASRK